MTVAVLKRSKDRKVANAVTPSGQPTIANTFGLPSGKDYSCPNATSFCGKVCYAGKLEKVYKGVRETLLHNYETLRSLTMTGMVDALDAMIVDFIAECEKRGASKLFRIHWDGDFFSPTYVRAWSRVIARHQDVQFWCYTRVPSAAIRLKADNHRNLSLYFSADPDNRQEAVKLRALTGVRLAWLGDTFAEGQQMSMETVGAPGGKCPENLGRIPLISPDGSACVRCGLCIYGKADIVFSRTKK